MPPASRHRGFLVRPFPRSDGGSTICKAGGLSLIRELLELAIVWWSVVFCFLCPCFLYFNLVPEQVIHHEGLFFVCVLLLR